MLQIGDHILQNRLFLGTALYPSPEVMAQSIKASETNVITVSIRRQAPDKKSGQVFWDFLKSMQCQLLPNTAGCHTAKEVIVTANMTREIFNTHWIKLEVIGDEYNLQPDPFELLIATKELLSQGFEVFPYCIDDLVLCQKLVNLGCKIVMPWGSPIGSGQGLLNPYAIRTLRQRLPETLIFVDAGIGTPSDAVKAMELGVDGILLNSAVALAHDPIKMARSFNMAIQAGRLAYEAGRMPQRDFAVASTPLVDTPFWLNDKSTL